MSFIFVLLLLVLELAASLRSCGCGWCVHGRMNQVGFGVAGMEQSRERRKEWASVRAMIEAGSG